MIPLDLKYFDIEIYLQYLDVELLDVERIEEPERRTPCSDR
jgi:hypothetical protein